MSLTTIMLPVEVTATGEKQPVDVSSLGRVAKTILTCKSNNGTNPTLTTKLQSSAAPAIGASYTTTGAVDTILREGATTTIKLGAKWTQSGARTLAHALLKLKRNGALASGTLTLELYADSSGPTGSALASATLDLSLIGTSAYEDYLFTFTSTYELATSTVYWLVLTGDYTESATDNITWRTKGSVAGAAGNYSVYGTEWAADTAKSFEFAVYQYTFADITGGGFTEVTTTGSLQEIDLWIDDQPQFVRAYNTIGGTSTPKFHAAVVMVT